MKRATWKGVSICRGKYCTISDTPSAGQPYTGIRMQHEASRPPFHPLKAEANA